MKLFGRLLYYLRAAQTLRTQSGPYRFLVRRWDQISDIDLAVRVMQTEFFSGEITPVALPIKQLRSILVLAPHQDDGVIGAGGTLLLASAAGVSVNIAYITDGAVENHPSGVRAVDSAAVRFEEAQRVCSSLGAGMYRLNISNITPCPTLDDLDHLSALIHDLKPQVIMAPWLLDLPAKHRLVNHLLWLADKRTGLPDMEVWGYQIHNTLMPNGYVNITEVSDRKRELIRCFRFENEYVQAYEHLAMGMNAWNARFLSPSPQPRFIEAFFTLPLKEFLSLVERLYFNNLRVTYRGHKKVLPAARSLHQAVTRETI